MPANLMLDAIYEMYKSMPPPPHPPLSGPIILFGRARDVDPLRSAMIREVASHPIINLSQAVLASSYAQISAYYSGQIAMGRVMLLADSGKTIMYIDVDTPQEFLKYWESCKTRESEIQSRLGKFPYFE